MSEHRGLFINTDDQQWRLWQLAQADVTLQDKLYHALAQPKVVDLAQDTYRCAVHYIGALQRFRHCHLELRNNLSSFGFAHHGAGLVYVDVLQKAAQSNAADIDIQAAISAEFTSVIADVFANKAIDVAELLLALEELPAFDEELQILSALKESFADALA